jgi:hypothetical protein
MNKVKAKIINSHGPVFKISAYAVLAVSVVYLFVLFNNKIHQTDGSVFFPFFQHPFWLLAGLLSGTLNWWLRIKKWQVIASQTEPVSFHLAAFQQMSAYAWSFFTPFNSGEFVHKPLFFNNKKEGLKAVGTEQISQMTITLWLGLSALPLYLTGHFAWSLIFLSAGITVWFFTGAFGRKILFLSLLRYFIFGGLMLLGFTVFIPWVPVIEVSSYIAVYYMAVSFLPLIPLFDLPVKTGLAVWIFGPFIHRPEFIAGLMFWMWLWNTFIPALFGQIWFGLRLYKTDIL